MGMVSLIYVSYATKHMYDEDLVEILDKARTRNKPEGITGMLLYRDRYFIQVIEGEEKRVDQLFADISRDKRHSNIVVIEKTPINRRSFDQWSMGFNNLDTVDPEDHPGFSDFLSRPVTEDYFMEDTGRARNLLMAFKKGIYF